MTKKIPTAKQILIDAAKQYAKVEGAGFFGAPEHFAKRLAMIGLSELLGKHNPLSHILRDYMEFQVNTFPVDLSEEKLEYAQEKIDAIERDFEALTIAMFDEVQTLKAQLAELA